MRDVINKILETSVYAPSGHNYQPWQFSIEGNTVVLKNLPKNDQTIYNFWQRGSFIAHGAIVENIIIAANYYGYDVKVDTFPKKEDDDLIANLSFTENPISKQSARAALFPYIKKRSTNRNPYKRKKMDQNVKRMLLTLPSDLDTKDVQFLEEEGQKREVAKALSVNDWLIFNNQEVHKSLFPHIVWTKKEELKKRSGLYIETFELPPPVKAAFKLFKYWHVARFFGLIGFGTVVAKQNAQLYSSAAAFVGIKINKYSPLDFFTAGRTLQHLWLNATKEGMSIQPVMGVLFLCQRLQADVNHSLFTKDQIKKIYNGGEVISNLFKTNGKTLAITFRIGYGAPPSTSSSKQNPNIT